MSGEKIFLSYASADRERVKPIVQALESQGLDVWWDRDIPRGKNFSRVIEESLNQARCAVVVWSQASIVSEWVFNEASMARKRGILVPALIDSVEPPLEFRHLQAADLCAWSGDETDAELNSLIEAVRGLVQDPGKPLPARAASTSPHSTPKLWWQTAAGAALGAGSLLASLSVLLIVLNQLGWIGKAATVRPAGVAPAPAEPTTAAPNRAAEPSAAGGVSMASPTERSNLLTAEAGGKLVLANEDTWKYLIDSKTTTVSIATHGFAVFAFRDEQAVTVDAIGIFVENTADRNVKQLAVFAADESENGPFRKVAVLTLPNVRNMRGPFHEFKVGPLTTRYLKIELMSWQGSDDYPNGYVGTLAVLGRQGTQ